MLDAVLEVGEAGIDGVAGAVDAGEGVVGCFGVIAEEVVVGGS